MEIALQLRRQKCRLGIETPRKISGHNLLKTIPNDSNAKRKKKEKYDKPNEHQVSGSELMQTLKNQKIILKTLVQ